ncbi:MAG: hypothetical protein K8R59_02940, partial [Thermoanaerobaculales bacterium]|nr:hypothetical protein [Thermoanaerobaculales bacterium]
MNTTRLALGAVVLALTAMTWPAGAAEPWIVELRISPESWSGYGLHEIVEFQCSAVWSDGAEDPHCDRDTASSPIWTVYGCGVLTSAPEGETVLWCSEHNACDGEVRLSYGEFSQTASLSATLPTSRDDLPLTYGSHVDLSGVTDATRFAYCSMNDAEWEQYYAERLIEAQEFSDALEQYILDWYHGEADARIPIDLLPPTVASAKSKDWTLKRPEDVDPQEQWYIYPARSEPALDGFSGLIQNNAATNVTYLKALYIAPLGAQLLVEGDFPHARFMSYQIVEPFDPRFPVAANLGVMEVPIVDVDIDPDDGHVNPFRVGADRNTTNRHYHVAFDLEAGNAVELNRPVMGNPHFRDLQREMGNRRVGGPFASSGPYGDGGIVPGVLWLRYYAPDWGAEPLAGVPIPKVTLKLETGEEFWIQADFSLGANRGTVRVPGQWTRPQHPEDELDLLGPSLGWFKIFGLLQVRLDARGYQDSPP